MYTDRSRYEIGVGRCPMLRYLQYHAGPTGYGFRRTAASLPLVTGTGLHDGLAPLLTHVMLNDTLPDEDLIRQVIADQAATYRTQVERRSLADVGEIDPVYLAHLIDEQTSLITGLIWAFALDLLPQLHAENKIISVEVEEALVLDCTCGIGDRTGTFADHEAKECNGIGVQGRGDFLTENRQSGMVSYDEFKTTGRLGQQFGPLQGAAYSIEGSLDGRVHGTEVPGLGLLLRLVSRSGATAAARGMEVPVRLDRRAGQEAQARQEVPASSGVGVPGASQLPGDSLGVLGQGHAARDPDEVSPGPRPLQSPGRDHRRAAG